MRTILALDDLLAHAVKPKLIGEVEICNHQTMREKGPDVVQKLVRRRSVLAIGGAAWDPLPLLRKWRLPPTVHVVMVTPSVTEEHRQGVDSAVSIVPADGSVSGLSSCIADACLFARGRRRAALSSPCPVVVRAQPRRVSCQHRESGRLLRLKMTED